MILSDICIVQRTVSHMLVLEPFLQDHGLSVGRNYLLLLSSKEVEKDAIFK